MNPESQAILDALLENRKIAEARLDRLDSRLDRIDSRLDGMDSRLDGIDSRLSAVETKLDAVAVDVAAIKEQLVDMTARDEYLTRKTSELEADLYVVKRRQKA